MIRNERKTPRETEYPHQLMVFKEQKKKNKKTKK